MLYVEFVVCWERFILVTEMKRTVAAKEVINNNILIIA